MFSKLRLGVSVIFILLGELPPSSHAQTVGYGSSPGRAAYRTPEQWNSGPYYTTYHIDPYAPHRMPDTTLQYSEPTASPFGDAPRGRFGTFSPSQGNLYRYEQGFSPLSDYADWYRQTYRFTPNDDQILNARRDFFRSAPIQSYVRVLPPLPGIPGPSSAVAAAPAQRTTEDARAKLVRPSAVRAPIRSNRAVIYRSSVAGGS